MAFQYSITAVGAMMMQSALNILGELQCKDKRPGQMDTLGNTGICGVGYHDGDVLCTEYGGRQRFSESDRDFEVQHGWDLHTQL